MEWYAGLYLNDSDQVVIPANNVYRMLIEGLRRRKLGKKGEAAVFFDVQAFELKHNGPKDLAELYANSRPLVIFFDGFQMILGHALRGLGETWIPTGIQTFVYVVIMSPLSYYLAIPMGRGVLGLLEAVVYASVVSVALQGFHFYQKTRAAYPLIERT